MKYDLGLSTGKFSKFWDKHIPDDRQLEFAAFALTPGIPTEFVLFVAGLRRWQINYAFNLVDDLRSVAEPLGLENAATITVQDGYNMWRPLARKKYRGPPPHWTSIALDELLRTRQKTIEQVMAELRIAEYTVFRLRKNRHFDPFTLKRVTRGNRKRHFQPLN